MKTIISIALVWLAIALATAFVWHRLRRHEKYMESLLPKEEPNNHEKESSI
ncbi:MAG: hypothetical protein KKF27_20615 [Gammaproteobacteria bacterium]|nr:hypothetical protein [Gammaproteobacteria bacterium]